MTAFAVDCLSAATSAALSLLAEESGRACTRDATLAVRLHAWSERSDELFQCIHAAIDEKRTMNYKTNPVFDPFREDPRFAAALRRINLEP